MKNQLLFIIALLWGATTQIFAHNFEAVNSDGVTIYYNIIDATNKKVCVTYKGTDKESGAYTASLINIPSSVEYDGQTYSVTEIGEYAFYGCFFFNECAVSLPSTIESIKKNAFNSCGKLTLVSFTGSSLKSIEAYAFSKCYNLSSIEIPNSVNEIGTYAFWECNRLTKVTLPLALKDINAYAFYSCAQLKTVEIQGNVETIGNHAFDKCIELNTVTISGNIQSIGERAFSGCKKLQNITIPSVATIADFTFDYCSSLSTIEIKNSVTSIGKYAFNHCESLTSISLPKSLSSINPTAFAHCSKLEEIKVDSENEYFCDVDGILYTKDQEKLVMYCAGRQGEFTIPSKTKIIGEKAFIGCSNLTALVIPSSVVKISANAIANCAQLEKITFQGNPEIGDLGSLDFVAYVYSETTTPQAFTASFPFASTTKVYVSSAAYQAYKTAAGWKDCNIINCGPFNVAVNATNCTVIGTGTFEKNSKVTLTVKPATGYEFTQWSDGNTDNPRIIASLTEDTELTVECSLIDIPTGISSVQSDVISCEYYDINGRQLSQAQKGIVIVVKHHADGSTTREKQVIK